MTDVPDNLVPLNRIVEKNKGPKTVDVRVAVEKVEVQMDPDSARKIEKWNALLCQFMANQTAEMVHLTISGVKDGLGTEVTQAIMAHLRAGNQTIEMIRRTLNEAKAFKDGPSVEIASANTPLPPPPTKPG